MPGLSVASESLRRFLGALLEIRMLGLKSMLTGRGLIASSAVLQRCGFGASSPYHATSEVLGQGQDGIGNEIMAKTGRQPARSQEGIGRYRLEGRPSSSRLKSEPVSPPQLTKNSITTPRFERIWWDKGSESRNAVSIWRPKPPSGYAVLGDCLVEGLEPPSSALVLRDDDSGSTLRKPTKYFWRLDTPGTGLEDVYIWFPVAPSGYVAMGCIATSTKEKPPLDQMRCIRSDYVTQVSISKEPLWSLCTEEISYFDLPYKWSLWKVENQAHTFFAGKSRRRPSEHMAHSLATRHQSLLEEHDQRVQGAEKVESFQTIEQDMDEWVLKDPPQSMLQDKNLRVSGEKKCKSSKTEYKCDDRVKGSNSPSMLEEKTQAVQGTEKLEPSKKMADEKGESVARNHPPSVLQDVNQRAQHGLVKLEISEKIEHEIRELKARISETVARIESLENCGTEHGDKMFATPKLEHEGYGKPLGKNPQIVPQEKNHSSVPEEKSQPCMTTNYENHDCVSKNHPQQIFEEYSQSREQAGKSQSREQAGKSMEFESGVLARKQKLGYDWTAMAKIGLVSAAGLAIVVGCISPYILGWLPLKYTRMILRMLFV